ncbi:MAG TPA: class II aldolase, partial [Pseudomonas sp.]|nr:class II aldolase [Pseudomonas sp.]
MNAVHALSDISLKNKVSAEEWQVRVELAAAYRL